MPLRGHPNSIGPNAHDTKQSPSRSIQSKIRTVLSANQGLTHILYNINAVMITNAQ